MATETMYTRLFWILVAAIVGGVGSVIVFAFGVRSDVNIMRVQLDGLSVKFEEVKLDMRQRTELRYTSLDAAKDRDAFTAWNRDQDKQINDLQVWRAAIQQQLQDRHP